MSVECVKSVKIREFKVTINEENETQRVSFYYSNSSKSRTKISIPFTPVDRLSLIACDEDTKLDNRDECSVVTVFTTKGETNGTIEFTLSTNLPSIPYCNNTLCCTVVYEEKELIDILKDVLHFNVPTMRGVKRYIKYHSDPKKRKVIKNYAELTKENLEDFDIIAFETSLIKVLVKSDGVVSFKKKVSPDIKIVDQFPLTEVAYGTDFQNFIADGMAEEYLDKLRKRQLKAEQQLTAGNVVVAETEEGGSTTEEEVVEDGGETTTTSTVEEPTTPEVVETEELTTEEDIVEEEETVVADVPPTQEESIPVEEDDIPLVIIKKKKKAVVSKKTTTK